MKLNRDDLLLKALLEEVGEEEAEQLKKILEADNLAVSRLHEWKKIKSALKSYQPHFGHGFSERLLAQIGQFHSGQREVYKWLLRFSLGTVAAVLLMLIYVVWQENPLSVDGILGLKYLMSEDFTNLLANY